MAIEGGNSSHGGVNNPKPTESGGCHLLHHIASPMSSGTITSRITLLFIAAAMICLVIYHSAHGIQYFFPISYNLFSSNISEEFTKSNLSISPPTDSSHGRNRSGSNLTSPTITETSQDSLPSPVSLHT